MVLPADDNVNAPLNRDSTYDLLKDDKVDDKEEDLLTEDKEEEVEDKENEDDSEEESDKEDEKEEKEDELDEEELDLGEEELDLIAPVRKKEIIAKYPNLFKDFPYLEKAYYKEQQFTELFPTVDDAKATVEKAQALDTYANELNNGNLKPILEQLHKNDRRSFGLTVDNLLISLHEVDPGAFAHIATNIGKTYVGNMAQVARQTGNEAMMAAATLAYQFITGKTDWEPPSNFAKEEPKKDDSLALRQQEFEQNRFQMVATDLGGKIENAIRSTVQINIDPKGQMTDFVKSNAVDRVMSLVEQSVQSDTRFGKLLDRMWQEAARNNYHPSYLKRIDSAYKSRAKVALRQAIPAVRAKALKGLRVRNEEEINRGPVKGGRPGQNRDFSETKRIPSSKDNASKGMSTRDFFMKD